MTNFVEGENVSLFCDVFGVPYPSVSWINVTSMERVSDMEITKHKQRLPWDVPV